MDEVTLEILKTIVNEFGDYDDVRRQTTIKLPSILFCTDEELLIERDTLTDAYVLTLKRR
jgi:hypothetical protein